MLARGMANWINGDKFAPGELDRLYNQAVKSDDWGLLIGVVNSFAADKDVPLLLRPIQRKGAGALTAAGAIAETKFQMEDWHPVRRALAFFRMEPQVGRQARPSRDAGWTLGALNGSPLQVPGGTVNLYDEVTDSRGGRSDHFALQYTGADAEKTGWLQFVAVEVEAFDKGEGGSGSFLNGTMTGRYQNETISFGTASSPKWYLDATHKDLPFYESSGTSIVDYGNPGRQGQTTMIDRPESDPKSAERGFRQGARRLERRVRFHQYLVRGQDVLFENDLVVQDTYWGARDVPVRRNIFGKRGAANQLQAAHHNALVRRHPNFNYFDRPIPDPPRSGTEAPSNWRQPVYRR